MVRDFESFPYNCTRLVFPVFKGYISTTLQVFWFKNLFQHLILLHSHYPWPCFLSNISCLSYLFKKMYSSTSIISYLSSIYFLISVDLFSPILEDVDIAGGIIHNPQHTRNLYIVAGTLTAAVVVMILILIGCYCRISQAYMSCCGISRLFWYKKYREWVHIRSLSTVCNSTAGIIVDHECHII